MACTPPFTIMNKARLFSNHKSNLTSGLLNFDRYLQCPFQSTLGCDQSTKRFRVHLRIANKSEGSVMCMYSLFNIKTNMLYVGTSSFKILVCLRWSQQSVFSSNLFSSKSMLRINDWLCLNSIYANFSSNTQMLRCGEFYQMFATSQNYKQNVGQINKQ